MKKVLILGGGGFIGYNIANYLILKKDYQITLADIHFKLLPASVKPNCKT